jgi:hypothetical protein
MSEPFSLQTVESDETTGLQSNYAELLGAICRVRAAAGDVGTPTLAELPQAIGMAVESKIADAVKAEREACAAVCMGMAREYRNASQTLMIRELAGVLDAAAKAIRDRE